MQAWCRRIQASSRSDMARIQEDVRRLTFWRSLLAEFLGTMFLVLIGCGSWADVDKRAYLFAVKVALAFGLTLAAILYCMRSLGEPHLNPAVSLAMLVTRRTSVIKLALCVVCQFLGAILGAAFVKAITVGNVYTESGCTIPMANVSDGQGFGAEFFATFFYVFIVFACYDKAKAGEEVVTPFVIGLTYAAVILFALPYSGGSANTARSFGPALVNNVWKGHWIYWFGPLFGGIAGGGVYDLIFSTKSSFTRIKSCLMVFHPRDDSGTSGGAGGPSEGPASSKDLEKAEDGEEVEEGDLALKKDSVMGATDDVTLDNDDEVRKGEYPPGGPGDSERGALRDSSKPRIKLQRPKFTCCQPQRSPEPLRAAHIYQQQPEPAVAYEQQQQQQSQFQQQSAAQPELGSNSKETQTSEDTHVY